ncbi:transferase hexapeptide repeat containing protein [Leptothrix cholodnii SP-6]|uniref:Transferase hexapeptide repeat containing protein n=1 Tax=Leptothrix cholodnii (strain ATCC 51168 / LMG 8142 / SP-6) TaxID=395495 RepID=B1XZR8_LEPCP|nr:acyltransferase [Leptothrix cholodnii]ACB32914.1 transferase hexapeptide repeat containing protein [Leptothrix cholodnii SP-6]
MAYYTETQLQAFGFRHLGQDVKISDKASIYNADQIEIGDHSRIDDFCVLSGRIRIGRYNHVTPMCLVAGGVPGVFMDDFCTLAYGVKVFSQTDDYSGATMTNSLIPRKYKNEQFAAVTLRRQTIVGAGAIVMPGVEVAEGCAIGAMALVTKSTLPWGIYAGVPARRTKDRLKGLLDLEQAFLKEEASR